VAIMYGESMVPFLIPMVVSLFLGVLFDKSFTRGRLNLNEGLSLTAMTFILFSLVGSIPYLYMFTGTSDALLLDSFFEAMSGFTTTGLTVIEDMSAVPKSILFWRSETQWLGGIGIIIIFLSILSRLRTSSTSLYEAQGYTEKLEPTVMFTTRRMMKIYLTYSVFGVVLLYLSGLGPFEAVTTMFSSISTGGFVVSDDIFTTAGDATLAVICVLMLIGSINFMIHDKIFKRRINDALANVEVQSMAVMIFVSSLVLYVLTWGVKMSIFETISAITATGFTLEDVSLFPTPVLLVLTILMYVGSSSGTGTVIFTYTAALVLGTMIFVFLGYTPLESFFQVTSAQGTVGMNIIDIASAPAIAKITLIFSMLLGRLEIFPILILIHNLFKR